MKKYKTFASLRHIVVVETPVPEATLWSRPDGGEARDEAGWTAETIEGIDASIDLPAIDMTLPLPDIYDRIGFDAPPSPG